MTNATKNRFLEVIHLDDYHLLKNVWLEECKENKIGFDVFLAHKLIAATDRIKELDVIAKKYRKIHGFK